MRSSRSASSPYYEYFNANPKGRLGSDCVVRAIALACRQSWEQTVREMTELGLKRARLLNDPELYPAYLESKGFVAHKEPRDAFNRKISVKEFLDKREAFGFKEGEAAVAVAGTHHATCLEGGKVRDIWDCSGQTMHRWWSRKV